MRRDIGAAGDERGGRRAGLEGGEIHGWRRDQVNDGGLLRDPFARVSSSSSTTSIDRREGTSRGVEFCFVFICPPKFNFSSLWDFFFFLKAALEIWMCRRFNHFFHPSIK